MTDASTTKTSETELPSRESPSTTPPQTLAELSARLAAEVDAPRQRARRGGPARRPRPGPRPPATRAGGARRPTSSRRWPSRREATELARSSGRSSSRSPSGPPSWSRRSTSSKASAGPSLATARRSRPMPTPWPPWTRRRPISTPQSAARAARKAATTDGGDVVIPPAVSRLVLTGQEDLRREIARAMHDGPAQSLTNIVLQAQIVERLVAKDPALAHGEVRQLVGDGPADARGDQVVHLRRPARWSSTTSGWCRRCGAPRASAGARPVSRSSSTRWARTGGCRWTSRAGCSGSSTRRWSAYLERSPDPDHAAARLVRPGRGPGHGRPGQGQGRQAGRGTGRPGEAPPTGAELPPALAAMMEDRRADARDAAEAARRDAIVVLPVTTWREIQSRARHARHPRRPVGGRFRAAPRGRGAGAAGAMTCAACPASAVRASSSTA